MQRTINSIDHEILAYASKYAKKHSGCTKVQVGSVIIKNRLVIIGAGANRTDLDLCKTKGCLRIEKYGDNAKTHRNPDDCRAIHSEIDAIAKAAMQGGETEGAAIYVTRYPCESCARAIVAAGIKEVVYGRETKISEQTALLFYIADITVTHISDYKEEDVTT